VTAKGALRIAAYDGNLNAHVKHDRIGRAGVTSPDDLKAKALAALHRLQRLPHIVQGFFRDPNLRYVTA